MAKDKPTSLSGSLSGALSSASRVEPDGVIGLDSGASSEDRDSLSASIMERAGNESADADKVAKSENERLIEKQTGIEVTRGEHPTDAGRNDLAQFGAAMARGFIEEMKKGTDQAASQVSNKLDFGTTTGRKAMINEGSRIGYFPYRGGRGAYRGGWFLIGNSEEERVVNPQMTRIAVSKTNTTYDEGRGVLFHEIKRTDLQSWSDQIGVRMHAPEPTLVGV